MTPFSVAILAGGLATRLHPLTTTMPKSLIPINGEPFIDHQLRLLKRAGIQQVVLCVGHLAALIESHVQDGKQYSLTIRYAHDDAPLSGTGGAIRKALPLLSEQFFVLYGDSYLVCPYQMIQAAFIAGHQPAMMTIYRNKDCGDASNVSYDGNKIISYDKYSKNPAMEYIDYGLGIFDRSVFANVDKTPLDLAEIYQQLLKNQQLDAYVTEQRFYEVGSFAGIKELEYYLRQQKHTHDLIE